MSFQPAAVRKKEGFTVVGKPLADEVVVGGVGILKFPEGLLVYQHRPGIEDQRIADAAPPYGIDGTRRDPQHAPVLR